MFSLPSCIVLWACFSKPVCHFIRFGHLQIGICCHSAACVLSDGRWLQAAGAPRGSRRGWPGQGPGSRGLLLISNEANSNSFGVGKGSPQNTLKSGTCWLRPRGGAFPAALRAGPSAAHPCLSAGRRALSECWVALSIPSFPVGPQSPLPGAGRRVLRPGLPSFSSWGEVGGALRPEFRVPPPLPCPSAEGLPHRRGG